MTTTEYGKIISKNLKRIFYEAHKTQADVARDLNLNQATVSTWMNGTRIPRMDKIDLLCHYFNCSRADIMEDHDTEAEQGYYIDSKTARLAQEMFEDPQMRSLYHMKRNMEPEKFAAHYDMLKKMYQLEHPEDGDDWA